jgi:hypothetical protein
MGTRAPTGPRLLIVIVDSYDTSRIGLALMLGRAPAVAECHSVPERRSRRQEPSLMNGW